MRNQSCNTVVRIRGEGRYGLEEQGVLKAEGRVGLTEKADAFSGSFAASLFIFGKSTGDLAAGGKEAGAGCKRA